MGKFNLNDSGAVVFEKLNNTVLTVGTTTGCDYVCDGTADDVQIRQAILYASSIGGGVLQFMKGTYFFSSVIDAPDISNVRIVGESYGSVIFKASASVTGGINFKSGMINFKDSVNDSGNVYIENIIFDCNDSLNLPAMCFTPGDAGITMSNINLINCGFKNANVGTASVVFGAGFATLFTTGEYGEIDGLTIDRCKFTDNDLDCILFDGSNINNVLFYKSNFIGNGRSGVFLTTDIMGGVSDWTLKECRFEDNKKGDFAGIGADFLDKNLFGIKNFHVENNYFGPTSLPTTDNFNLCIYNSEGLRIIDNFFEGPSSISGLRDNAALAIGASKAASWARTDADRLAKIEGNIFYKVRAAWDGDAMYNSRIVGNMFYETQLRPMAQYSNHSFTVVDSNIMINCNTAPTSEDDYQYSGMYFNGNQGIIITNNIVADNRLLRNPTTGPTLSSFVGGSLPSRTYYVNITWVNDTGETLPSSEVNITVASGSLLKVTLPVTLGVGAPNGTKKANVYVGTTSGNATLQGSIDPAITKDAIFWNEPSTGLVAGAALPVSNTTNAVTRYGIYEVNVSTDGGYVNMYKNNIFNGMTDGGIHLAVGSNSICTGNIGYVTENSGTATVANGATTVVVNHGLSVTPTADDITVTPTNSMGNATKFYIGTFTSTQFTITVNADPGATTATFAWKAIVL